MGTARGKPPDEVMRSFWDVWLLRDVVKHKSSTHDARDLVPGCTYFCIANSDYDPSLETEQGLRILSNHIKTNFFIYFFYITLSAGQRFAGATPSARNDSAELPRYCCACTHNMQ